ncbi:hypothetical protein [Candidatus Methylacidithermus pantelleriae]|uniref:Uncharacterized protein n=1 Tax=Candidatus Methylacidithermus pantelleriae TaxID=2744239 RepID=A0A8J2FV79_9BACT|nr:hypothetical protein [Candidatus Methylacidithermus pantelleriae]CAF0691378.1 hypothetical protein MPNT_100026 [Candidatus Methylacidithermus pantelleriae]
MKEAKEPIRRIETVIRKLEEKRPEPDVLDNKVAANHPAGQA